MRFQIYKSEASTQKPWVVEDTAAPKYEDAVLYRFRTKRAAEKFVAEMLAERA